MCEVHPINRLQSTTHEFKTERILNLLRNESSYKFFYVAQNMNLIETHDFHVKRLSIW